MGEGEDLRSRLGVPTGAYNQDLTLRSLYVYTYTHRYIYIDIMMHGKAVRTVPIPRMTRILPVVIEPPLKGSWDLVAKVIYYE